jgi:hypothetical protein
MIAKTVGRVHASTSNDEPNERDDKAAAGEGEGDQKGQAGGKQEGPDEVAAPLHAVRKRGGEQHHDDRCGIGYGREQPGAAHREFGALANDGGEPENEAVDAETPAEVDDREQDYVRTQQRGANAADGGHIVLLLGELLFETMCGGGMQPLGLRWTVAHQEQPSGSPEHRWDALIDEGALPSHSLDQVPGHG